MPPNTDSFVHIQRLDGKDCYPSASSGAVGADEPAVSASMKWRAGSGSDPCERGGTHVVRVQSQPVFAGRPAVDVPLEILIGLEPPLDGDAGPAGTQDRAVFTAPAGAATPAVGGGSFGTATELDGPGSYTDAVFNKELVFYKVRLDWGQGLAYRVRFDGRGFVTTHWYSPARQMLGSDFAGHSNDREVTLDGTSDALGGPPVRYRNRELGPPYADVSVAGWYYIAVLVDLRSDPTPLTVTIDVSVTGDTRPGPGYQGGGTDPFGERAGGSGRAASAAGARGPGAGLGPLVWIGVPLVVLLLGGAAGVFALVRRRRGPSPA
jgi:Ca-activated chloride channel family protein